MHLPGGVPSGHVDRLQIRFALCDSAYLAELEIARAASTTLERIGCFTPLGNSPGADLDRAAAAKPSGFDNVRTAADDIAVIGVDDAERGKRVRACVVLLEPGRTNQSMTHELQEFVRNRLAPYKYPREIVYYERLPRTHTGKLQRKKLRTEQAVTAITDITKTKLGDTT